MKGSQKDKDGEVKRMVMTAFGVALAVLTPAAGADWSVNKRLSWTSGNSGYAAIAIDSADRLHVVWCDLTPGNWEIYYKKRK